MKPRACALCAAAGGGPEAGQASGARWRRAEKCDGATPAFAGNRSHTRAGEGRVGLSRLRLPLGRLPLRLADLGRLPTLSAEASPQFGQALGRPTQRLTPDSTREGDEPSGGPPWASLSSPHLKNPSPSAPRGDL